MAIDVITILQFSFKLLIIKGTVSYSTLSYQSIIKGTVSYGTCWLPPFTTQRKKKELIYKLFMFMLRCSFGLSHAGILIWLTGHVRQNIVSKSKNPRCVYMLNLWSNIFSGIFPSFDKCKSLLFEMPSRNKLNKHVSSSVGTVAFIQFFSCEVPFKISTSIPS